jgi:ornithine decarboxylase
VSFHVGSQQCDLTAWDRALGDAKRVFATLAEEGIVLKMVNMGGGFPTRYLKDVPAAQAYGQAIFEALSKHFGNQHPGDHHRAGPRHGRQCRRHQVGSRADLEEGRQRQCALGLSRHRQVRRSRRDDGRGDPLPDRHAARRRRVAPCVLAGPTCDSADVLYEKTPYPLPLSLTIGDEVLIEGTGAYTTTYSAVAFNGFEPLRSYVI